MHKLLDRRRSYLSFTCVAALVLSACGFTGDSDAGSEEPAETPSTTSIVESGDVTTSTAEPSTSAPEPTDEEAVVIDFGVTDTAIRIGYSLDLSGPFSAYDARVLDGHVAYFDAVNAAGGIDGREVELVRLDSSFDVPTHLDNIAQLVEESEVGVVAIGGLSHPNFDDATVSAVGDAGLLIIGNAEPTEPVLGATRVVPLRASVCEETAIGLSALVSTVEGDDPVSVAYIGREDEPWAQASQAAVLELVETLGLSLDVEVVGLEDLADVVSVLSETEVEVVWAAVSPRELGSLVGAFAEEDRGWQWSGPSVSFDLSLLTTDAAVELSRVYRHVSSIEPADQSSQSEARAALGLAFSDLTYGAAAPALVGYEQATLLHEVLLEAIAEGDATRAGVARVGERLAPGPAAPTVYSLDSSAPLSEPLSTSGNPSGLVELDLAIDGEAVLEVCE